MYQTQAPNSIRVCGILAIMWKLIFIAIVFGGSLFAQQGASTQEDPAQAAQATINWDRASSPGMKAEMLLVKKTQLRAHMALTYRVKVTGAPENQRYVLLSWPITFPKPLALMDGLAIDPNGVVFCPAHSTGGCAKNFDGLPINLEYTPVKGEVLRSALISADQKSKIFFSIVPDPIVTKEGACSLELVRLSPGFELVLIRAKGFAAGESIAFHTQSYDEVHDVNVKASPQGEFWAPLTPFVAGRKSGTSNVTAKGSKCSPALSFNWGEGQ